MYMYLCMYPYTCIYIYTYIYLYIYIYVFTFLENVCIVLDLVMGAVCVSVHAWM